MPPKDKKEKPKEKPAGWNFDPIEGLIVLLIFLAIFSTIMSSLIRYITSGEISFYGFKLVFIADFFKSHIQFFKTLGFVMTGVTAIGTFVYTKKGDAIWREEKAKIYPANIPTSSEELADNSNITQEKWKQIATRAESENASDWRLAIIEADIMLDDLLITLQLPGDTMGDKLKAIEPSDFLTLDQAWEAHKARNMIAHQGSDFLLNQRETRRIISLYEAVFKEFHLI